MQVYLKNGGLWCLGGGLWGRPTLHTAGSPSALGASGLPLVCLWRSNHHTVAAKAANSESATPAATLEKRMKDCDAEVVIN